MAGKTVVKFSYDLVSPWSYFAYAVLKRYQSRWDYDLVLNPIYLGGVMAGSGNKPPATIPNKARHMQQELQPISKFFGVDVTPPTKFPIQTMGAIRLLRAIRVKAPQHLEAATDNFFALMFSGIGDQWPTVEELGQRLTPKYFSNAQMKELLQYASSEENKEAVKADAGELVKQNCFGVPWIHTTKGNGESLTVFGSDRFEFMAHWLGKHWAGPNPSGGTTAKL